MKAAVLVRKGSGDKAFEIREVQKPKVKQGEVLIKVDAFGFYYPLSLMSRSVSIMGLNMLRIVEGNPKSLQYCLDNVVKLYETGIYKPLSGGEYPISELGKAHDLLEMRKTKGKVVVKWG
jgi:NADPH2:quinone reductase